MNSDASDPGETETRLLGKVSGHHLDELLGELYGQVGKVTCDEKSILSACVLTAATTLGLELPTFVTPHCEEKSRYSLPSISQTLEPSALSATIELNRICIVVPMTRPSFSTRSDDFVKP